MKYHERVKLILALPRKAAQPGWRPGMTHQYMVDWNRLSEVVQKGDMSRKVTCPETSQGLSRKVTGVVQKGDTNREENRKREQELITPHSPPAGDSSPEPVDKSGAV